MWFILSESAKENVRWSFMKYVGYVLLASDEVKSEVWRIKSQDAGRRPTTRRPTTIKMFSACLSLVQFGSAAAAEPREERKDGCKAC